MAQIKMSDIAVFAGGAVLLGTFGAGIWLAFSSSPSQLPTQLPSHKNSSVSLSHHIIHPSQMKQSDAKNTVQPTIKERTSIKSTPTPISGNPKPIEENSAKPAKTEIVQELKHVSLGKNQQGQEVTAVLSSHHIINCHEKKVACQRLDLTFLPMKQSFDLWQDITDNWAKADMVDVRSIALDPSHSIAQLLISGKLDKNIIGFFWYGAQEGGAQEEWHLIPVPYTYRGIMPEIVPGSDGVPPVLRVRDLDFSQNFPPLKLLRFENGHFIVTWNNLYHALFLQDLMTHLPPQKEAQKEKYKFLLTNEWLAYYVATLSMMGHFQQAWAYMLFHRDVSDEAFPKRLRSSLFKQGLISEKQYKEAPLHYSHLSSSDKRHFKAEKSIFDMLPYSEKQALLESVTH